MMRRTLILALLGSVSTPALGQSVPSGIGQAGIIWSPQQWQSFAASKADVAGGAAGAMISAAGAGSTGRALAAHFADTFNVKDYPGVVGNGSNDDTAGVEAALISAQQACQTAPTEIQFPPGRYMLSAAWSPAIACPYPLAITGAGPGMTSIVFANSDGFDITGTQTSGNLDVEVSGMRLLTAYTGATFANTGISITSPFVVGEEVHPVISHVLLTDVSLKQTNGWNVGIALNTTVNADLDDDLVELPGYNASTPTAGIGVQVQGHIAVSSDFSISTHVHHSTLTGGYAGVLVGAYQQTVDLGNDVIIGNDYGVHWDGSTAGDFAENLQVTSTNFNDLADDIWISHVNESQIEGNMLLQYGNAPSWAAVYIESSGWETITGNTVVALPQTAPFVTNNGFVIDNSTGSSVAVAGNIITGLHGACVVMSGTTTMVSAAGNVCNGPYITTPYQETNTGQNMLGPVSFNSQPAPVRYDGYHFDLIGSMPIVGPSGAASYLTSDGVSGLRLESVSNSIANLTIDGQIMGGGNLLPGVGGALVTRDAGGPSGSAESAGYVNPDGSGGLNFGTLKPNVGAEAGPIPTIVAALPACGSATWGHVAAVTDATVADTPANAGTVAAGGSTNGAFVRCIPKATSWTIY